MLDDHMRLHEPPGVHAVMPLRVPRGLRPARRPERDRLGDDRGPRRSDDCHEERGEEEAHGLDGSVDSAGRRSESARRTGHGVGPFVLIYGTVS